MFLRHAHANARRQRRTSRLTRVIPVDRRAREVSVEHGMRGSLRLVPMHVDQIAESSVRDPSVVPIGTHTDGELLRRHHHQH